MSAISVGIGITLVNLVRPGDGFDTAEREALVETLAPQAGGVLAQAGRSVSTVEALLSIIPRNPFEALVKAFDGEMLGVFFVALLLGIALTTTPRRAPPASSRRSRGVYAVSLRIIEFAMALAPAGVFALLFSLTARLGVDLLATLGRYVAVVLAGLLLQQFGRLLAAGAELRRPLAGAVLPAAREVMMTAFSTSSSAATLPTSIRVTQERLGVPRDIAAFVLTVGSTANQNGTALFEGVTVLFLAQLFGVELGLGAAGSTVVLLSILGGVGTAGVPGGSLPLIVVVLQSVGVPGEGIGVDAGRRPPARHEPDGAERDRRRDGGGVRGRRRGTARRAARAVLSVRPGATPRPRHARMRSGHPASPRGGRPSRAARRYWRGDRRRAAPSAATPAASSRPVPGSGTKFRVSRPKTGIS